ncbi:MAG: hypothetical protein F4Y28_07705 [Acidimicrobiia bacterium]|nr:hypothetical protein [Acidimicrobiia bacterium]MYG57165.1 hypothetical protein [Acidimicrobiia bacterium]MYJ31419.1 hypothetical protein [Acidimicrobiia bacterium]
MRNITVAVDEETHRLARIRAAELDTSVSALVRGYLRGLARGDQAAVGADALAETEAERRQRLLGEAIDDITDNGGGLRVAAHVPRDALHERSALR